MERSEEEQSGQSPVVRTVVANMKQLRTGKLTTDQLAERMRGRGINWTRLTVTKLEKNRRPNVSVDELVALALALDVSPASLLMPLGADPGEPVELGPGVVVPAAYAWDWLRVEGPLGETGVEITRERDEDFHRSARPAWDWRLETYAAVKAARTLLDLTRGYLSDPTVPPGRDIAQALRRVILELEELTGRTFIPRTAPSARRTEVSP
jgi:transcriptional regulator with XRE-family HTH domain